MIASPAWVMRLKTSYPRKQLHANCTLIGWGMLEKVHNPGLDEAEAQYVLDGVTSDFIDPGVSNLLDRLQPLTDWLNRRLQYDVEPYFRSTNTKIVPMLATRSRGDKSYAGVNFGSQDYLNLSSHPAVIAAAQQAAAHYGVHSAGSAALMGLSALTLQLEERIAAFLGLNDATVFPTGWGAGYGTIRSLVGRNDCVVIDSLAHACLQEGARAATTNVYTIPHLSLDALEQRLRRLQRSHTGGVLVVTETVFSMDSDVPDLRATQDVCRAYGATLFVDVAHDLGALGHTGRGILEVQSLLGEIDIVMGSFSKTFASNGGFAATNHPALKLALRSGCGPQTFSNALSPVQAATVLKCFDIVEGEEGDERRARLMSNVVYLRDRLMDAGFKVLGQPSAIVPIVVGDNRVSRLMTKYALESGAIVNLVEYPVVSRNSCRWRAQVMADHTKDHIDTFVAVAKAARESVGNA